MTKPTKWCMPSEDSDQSGHLHVWSESRCVLYGSPRTKCFLMRTAKTLIRLGGCPGWSESSLGAQVILLILSFAGSYPIMFLSSFLTGGCGGGILILNAGELFKVNGKLSANGQAASSRGGGGAGGSIHITTSEFDGTGDIEVRKIIFSVKCSSIVYSV